MRFVDHVAPLMLEVGVNFVLRIFVTFYCPFFEVLNCSFVLELAARSELLNKFQRNILNSLLVDFTQRASDRFSVFEGARVKKLVQIHLKQFITKKGTLPFFANSPENSTIRKFPPLSPVG